MAYYRRIRELREDHDMTQRQVAALLHMPQPQYFRYEQGYRDPPTDILIALADLIPHIGGLYPWRHQQSPPL